MCTYCFVITGCSTWQEQQRLESAVGAPMTAGGESAVRAAARGLKGERIAGIYSGDCEEEQASARIVSSVLGLRWRFDEGLHEMDYGLWQGLTLDELGRRQPRLLRQWMEEPCSVVPPGGESLEQARTRLMDRLEAIARRHRGRKVVVVLRPLMYALARCTLENIPTDQLWALAKTSPSCYWYELNGVTPSGETHG